MTARLHRCEYETTSTGIVIGSAYIPPPERMSEGAEVVQAWLLARESRSRDRWSGALFWATVAVAGLGFAVMVVF